MAPFQHLLHDHRLWGIRRKTVVPAVAIGLFIMWVPLPGHMVISSIVALLLRVNVPVAFVTTFLANPLTMPPMFLLAYTLGAWLLRLPIVPPEFDISLEWLASTFVDIWQPMLVGCVLLGAATSLIGATALDLLWRSRVADYKAAKRQNRKL